MDEKLSKTDMYCTMMNNLRALNFEAKERKEDLDTIKNDIKQSKIIYNQKIKKYHDIMQCLLQKETAREKIYKTINKHQMIQTHLFHLITPQLINELNTSMELLPSDIGNHLMTFLGYSNRFTITSLVNINKTPEDWIDLLQMISERKYEENTLIKITCIKNIPSPLNLLIDYCNSIIDINETNTQLLHEDKEMDQLINVKNSSFLQLKNIESEIIQKDCMYRSIIRYIKGIYSLFDRYNKLKLTNSKSSVSQSSYIDLYNAINEYRKINILNVCDVFDYMNHSTLKSEFSEEMSYISFQTNDFSMNQSRSNINNPMTTNIPSTQEKKEQKKPKKSNDNQVNVKGKVLNSEIYIGYQSAQKRDVVINMKKYQSAEKVRGFQQISAVLTQKCSENKLHKKKLEDNDADYNDPDDDDFNENHNNNESMDKSEFIPTEDHEVRKVRQIMFNKGINEITTKETIESKGIDDYESKHLYTNDNDCDMIIKTDSDFKYLKHINSFAVKPSKMAQDTNNNVAYSTQKKPKNHDQFFDMSNETQFCCTTACT